jgi:hypothetical protein
VRGILEAVLSPGRQICVTRLVKSAVVWFLALSLAAHGFDPNLVVENKTRPTAFVGIPWGSGPEEASRILSARAGASAPAEPADPSKLELTSGTFSGQAVERWTLEFANRKLYAATVSFKADGAAPALYRDLKQQLATKYGPALREGKPPIGIGADKKDRRAQQRLAPDQKLYGNTASWKFSPTLADKEPKTIELTLATAGGILATDESQLVVTIRYSNEAFAPLGGTAKSAPAPKTRGPDDL